VLVAFIAWRRLAPAERAGASRVSGIIVPVALAVACGMAAVHLNDRAKQLATVHRTQAGDAERVAVQVTQCLLRDAAASGRGFAPGLEAVMRSNDGDCAAVVGSALATRGQVVEYWSGPANQGARSGAFALCVRPRNVPDGGMTTVVADDSGDIRRAIAREADREAVPCAAAWGATASGVAKQLRYCALRAASRAGGTYPQSLRELIERVPGCLDEQTLWHSEGASGAIVRLATGELWVRYVPRGRSAEAAREYALYLSCSGDGEEAAVLDAAAVLQNADSPGARHWLAGCGRDMGADLALLAQQAGVRLPTVRTAPASAAREAEPDFGAVPDLEARRRECRQLASACYGLGRELERAVRLAGGNESRPEELPEAQLAWVREANEAFERACGGGSMRACAALADVLIQGRLQKDDPMRALELLDRSCTAGYAPACLHGAELHESGRRAMRTATVTISVTPGGAGKAITTSVPDETRAGIARDPEQAIEWFERACALGERSGCGRAARLLLELPDATAQQRARALGAYRALCDGGQAYACTILARWAEAHAGSAEGLAALEWRRRGCALGDATACAP
jgi:TPR repeat protein